MQIFLSAYLSTFRALCSGVGYWTLHQLHTYHFKRNRIPLHAQEMSFWAWIKMEIRFVSWLLLYYQVLLNILNYLFVLCNMPPSSHPLLCLLPLQNAYACFCYYHYYTNYYLWSIVLKIVNLSFFSKERDIMFRGGLDLTKTYIV